MDDKATTSKHIRYIQRTRRCSMLEAKKIAIKEDITSRVKKAENLEELREQILRIIWVI